MICLVLLDAVIDRSPERRQSLPSQWVPRQSLGKYQCCYLRVQPNAAVEAVSKSFTPEFAQALCIELARAKAIPLVALADYGRPIEGRLKAGDRSAVADIALQEVLNRKRGKV